MRRREFIGASRHLRWRHEKPLRAASRRVRSQRIGVLGAKLPARMSAFGTASERGCNRGANLLINVDGRGISSGRPDIVQACAQRVRCHRRLATPSVIAARRAASAFRRHGGCFRPGWHKSGATGASRAAATSER
jgi:hypothetical protein